MLVGLAVFVAPVRMTQILILATSLLTAVSMFFLQDNIYQLVVNAFAGLALAVAGVIAFVALGRGGLPENAGAPPDPELLRRKVGPLSIELWTYLGVLLSVPVFALLTQQDVIASWLLVAFGGLALGYVLVEALRGTKIERERLFVVLILTVFSLLFWAFFEQAGSSIANFMDRNVDRVFEARTVETANVGKVITLRVAADTTDAELKKLPPLTQEQLGEENGDSAMNDQIAEAMRLVNADKPAESKLSDEKLASFIKNVTSSKSLTITGLSALGTRRN